MLIFAIPSGYPNKYNRNSCSFIHEQVKKIQSNGHDNVVLDASAYGIKHWADRNCFKIENSECEGVNILSLHYWGLLPTKLPRLNALLCSIQLKRLYKKAVKIYGKPDILHAHCTLFSGYSACRLSQKSNIPFILTEHHSLFLQTNINKYDLKILNITIDNAKEFICVSENLKNAISKFNNSGKEISVIPNMVDDRFSYSPLPSKDRFVFFAAGNLYESKRFDLLIECFCEEFSNKKVMLNIAGRGPEEEKLMEIISANNCGNQVGLLGQLDTEQILERYIECDCFILLSKYETFGIVYREAMAVGRPVISTKNGGIDYEWDDRFGLLIESDTKEEVRAAMKKMVSDVNSYNNKEISKLCLEKFSSQRVADSIIQIYKKYIIDKPIRKTKG